MPAICRFSKVVLLALVCLHLVQCNREGVSEHPQWSSDQLRVIENLWLESLEPLPANPSNQYADSLGAAGLGHALFFDKRLSKNGKVSCATCHMPEKFFTDGLPLAVGIAPIDRHTMSIVESARSPWQFWDGRADSLWSQALIPLEHPHEHGLVRGQLVRLVYQFYKESYEEVFDTLPDISGTAPLVGRTGLGHEGNDETSVRDQMNESNEHAINIVFANIGKALEAYQRKLEYSESRFDRYAQALVDGLESEQGDLFTEKEIAGLKLFIGKGECIHCHNGPLFTNNEFHNTGVVLHAGNDADRGREHGLQLVLQSEFNCLGRYSDAQKEECNELRFVKTKGSTLKGAFRTPSLRNVAETAPYMHDGSLSSLREVIEHYSEAPFTFTGMTELNVLSLSGDEVSNLEAFLHTLSAPLATDEKWLSPPGK